MRLTKDNIDRFFDYDVSIDSRTIYLGEIDEFSAQNVIKGLHLLAVKDSKEDIHMLLNSPGGLLYDGMAIYDMILSLDVNVEIEVLGQAFSMAAIILQAGDVRIMHPSATLMIHDGTDYLEGHPRDCEAWAAQGKVMRKKMYEIFAKRSKQKNVSYWEKRCSKECILNPAECLELGLIDSIYGVDD